MYLFYFCISCKLWRRTWTSRSTSWKSSSATFPQMDRVDISVSRYRSVHTYMFFKINKLNNWLPPARLLSHQRVILSVHECHLWLLPEWFKLTLYIHIYIYAYVHTYIQYIHHTCIYTNIHTLYINTSCMHTYIYHACIYTNIHTYIYLHIYTYIHTVYIHIHIIYIYIIIIFNISRNGTQARFASLTIPFSFLSFRSSCPFSATLWTWKTCISYLTTF